MSQNIYLSLHYYKTLHSPVTSLVLSLIFLACEGEPSPSLTSAGEESSGGIQINGGEGPVGGEEPVVIECEASSLGLSSDQELCDLVDNDCDGVVDEGFDMLGMPCERRRMGCTREGVFACDSEGGLSCNAAEIVIGDEVCDEIDNDCDGETDEGFSLLIDAENCGACGVTCDVSNGVGRCMTGECKVGSCFPGYLDLNGDLTDGCECNQEDSERCDGLDNDCDGLIDEDFGVGSACVIGEGVCRAAGRLVCVQEDQATCDATPGLEMAEVCDGLDNDCDGVSDEDFDIDRDGSPFCQSCADCHMSGAGPCPDHCRLNDCDDADITLNPFTWDECSDGIDQNCDGSDALCTEAYARATQLTLISATDSRGTCPDQNGDGIGDNAFGLISGIANPLTEDYLARNQMNIIVGAYQFDTSRPETRFNLSVLLGSYYRNSNPPRYLLRQTNYDENGRPVMLFPFAQINDGQLEGGPGTFLFNAPFANSNGETILIQVPIEGAYIRGTFNYGVNQPDRFNLTNGIVSGYINKETLQESLVLLDPPVVRVIESLITPDLDLNQDGDPDYYSICLLTTLTGVDIEIEEPTPEPEPVP